MVNTPVVIVFGPSALPVARKTAAAIGGDVCEGGADFLREAFTQHRPVIGICAAGILIRLLAPLLADKTTEPPVIAVSEDGACVVPLLGGHHGANDLARTIASAIGGTAAITTAGDVRFSIALDDPPKEYTLANPGDAKACMAALLAGKSAKLLGNAPWISSSELPLTESGDIELCVTNKIVSGSTTKLVFHPQNLALGVGCARGCPANELIGLAENVLDTHHLAAASLACIVSIDVKADESAVHALGAHFDVPVRFYSAEELNAQTSRLANPSQIVMDEVGCPGVSEGACLAASGEDGQLVVEKSKSAQATCAIAQALSPIIVQNAGRARGRVSVIGIGPGHDEWRSGQASQLLREASDWVGYGLYLDIVAALSDGKTLHRFDLGKEEARVRHALELAGTGLDVALVCSGDAGIYAMAALVFELIDEPDTGAPVSNNARRVEIVVAPGISAFQAAAARAGAPIGHDFCAISLSDLLTPWEVIEARLKAAAEGDFVVAFYNPKSMRRSKQIIIAMEILAAHRTPDTPVILATNLGRPGEQVRTTTIAEFNPEDVDMLTLVMVGSSTSRRLETGDGKTWVFTPRGYDKKRKIRS
jgi:cobalt-precorrin 5A hydrolase/precorrin-3B C17-methyltransferase